MWLSQEHLAFTSGQCISPSKIIGFLNAKYKELKICWFNTFSKMVSHKVEPYRSTAITHSNKGKNCNRKWIVQIFDSNSSINPFTLPSLEVTQYWKWYSLKNLIRKRTMSREAQRELCTFPNFTLIQKIFPNFPTFPNFTLIQKKNSRLDFQGECYNNAHLLI